MRISSMRHQVSDKQEVKRVEVPAKTDQKDSTGNSIDAANKAKEINTDIKAKQVELKEVEKTSTASKTDSVQISDKSAALASEDKTDKTSKATEAKVAETKKPQNIRSEIRTKQRELRQVLKDLKGAGVSRKEISRTLRTANREANKGIAGDLKQAYKDYRGKKIDRNEFRGQLYAATAKKLDGIVSGMKNLYDQKTASASNNKEATSAVKETASVEKRDDKAAEKAEKNDDKKVATAAKPETAEKAEKPEKVEKAAKEADKEVAKAEKNEKPEKAEKAEKDDDDDDDKKVATAAKPEKAEKAEKDDDDDDDKKVATAAKPETAEKAEKDDDDDEKITKYEKNNKLHKADKFAEIMEELFGADKAGKGESKDADKMFGGIVSMFHEIDKMINAFDKEIEAEEKVEAEEEGFSAFVNQMSKMFEDTNTGIGNGFSKNMKSNKQQDDASGTEGSGMANFRKETLEHLYKSGNTENGFGVNRVGDSGEGSGNFTATRFMSSMANNTNDALESYKEVKDATEEHEDKKDAKEVNETNKAKQVTAEARFSTLA